jgi:2-C-methyl-D-erythritol 2,4-cyclodiphosphate synthase
MTAERKKFDSDFDFDGKADAHRRQVRGRRLKPGLQRATSAGNRGRYELRRAAGVMSRRVVFAFPITGMRGKRVAESLLDPCIAALSDPAISVIIPADSLIARRWVTSGLRIGIGHDTHRLADGGPLRLGGIQIAWDRHLVGHSDADVLLHAVTDALLGAAACGDIGELFPDTDADNLNRDSAEMLQAAYTRVRAAGFRVGNLDCIIFAERPKLSQHKLAIQQRIAALLDLTADRVGVKAKTGEGIGAVGTGQAIMAQCVALLEQYPETSGQAG